MSARALPALLLVGLAACAATAPRQARVIGAVPWRGAPEAQIVELPNGRVVVLALARDGDDVEVLLGSAEANLTSDLVAREVAEVWRFLRTTGVRASDRRVSIQPNHEPDPRRPGPDRPHDDGRRPRWRCLPKLPAYARHPTTGEPLSEQCFAVLESAVTLDAQRVLASWSTERGLARRWKPLRPADLTR